MTEKSMIVFKMMHLKRLLAIALPLACLFVGPVKGVKIHLQPKLLVADYAKIRFEGLERFLSMVLDTSLLEFVRLRRYRAFSFDAYYNPPTERNNELILSFVQGEKPTSIINDLVDLPSFVNHAKTLRSLLDKPSVLKELRTTENFISLYDLPLEERKQLVTFIIKHQHRRVYSEDFYLTLDNWGLNGEIIEIDGENWELFDFLYFGNAKYGENGLATMFSLLNKLAEKDDFALLRLSSLLVAVEDHGLSHPLRQNYLKGLQKMGNSMQRTIIALGKRRLEHFFPQTKLFKQINATQKTNMSSLLVADKIGQVYQYFKELLKHQKDDSPAFLLELLSMTIPINTKEKALELLEDLVRSYPPEKISPFHLHYTLGYSPEIARQFRNNIRKNFGGAWAKLFDDKSYGYYFPNSALTKMEMLDYWRTHQGTLLHVEPNQVKMFVQAKTVEGVFKMIDNEYRFFCGQSYNGDLFKRFVNSGFYFMAFGIGIHANFVDRLPHKLKEVIRDIHETWPDSFGNFKSTKEFISCICVDPDDVNILQGHVENIVKLFLDGFEQREFPASEYFLADL